MLDIKVRQLYKVLSPSTYVLLSFCVEEVLLTISTFFYACVGCSISRAHFHSGLVLEDNCRSSLSITDIVRRPQAVLK